MIDLFDFFDEKLIFNDIGDSPIKIATPKASVILNNNTSLTNNQMILPKSLVSVYEQISFITIIWNISSKEGSGIEKFKDNPWLQENYLNKGYQWDVIHEYLSGYINITKAEDVLNTNFCKEQAYHYTLKNLNKNPEDFFPFDIHWSLTACLKKEGDTIIDNIWLVHTDGETLHDMKLTIEEYLHLAYKAKGFHYWQLIYILKEETFYHELMKRFLPKIFPHVDLDLKKFNI